MMQQSELSPKETTTMKRQEVLGKISQAYVDHVLTRNVTPDEMPETSSEYIELLVEREGKKLYRHVGQLILLVANIHTLRSDLFANSMAERQNKQLNETTINQLRTLLELIKLEITRIKSKKLSDTKKRAREDVNIFLGAKEGIVDLPKTNLFNKMKLIIARQVVALIGKVMSARDREQWSDYIVDKAITDEELFPEHAETIKKLDVMLRIIQNPELETKQLLQTLLYLLPGLDDYGVSNDFLADMFQFAQKETSS